MTRENQISTSRRQEQPATCTKTPSSTSPSSAICGTSNHVPEQDLGDDDALI